MRKKNVNNKIPESPSDIECLLYASITLRHKKLFELIVEKYKLFKYIFYKKKSNINKKNSMFINEYNNYDNYKDYIKKDYNPDLTLKDIEDSLIFK